jgi:hypothetical protein
MNRFFSAVLMTIVLVMPGCRSGQIEEMKKNLGAYQYIGLDPQLSFSLAGVEFRPPEHEYSSPTVRYTVNIKQNNRAFPLNKYLVLVVANVVDSQRGKRAQITLQGTVENGVVSLSDVETLYGLKTRDQADLNSCKLQIEYYNWSPEAKYKPYEAGSHGQ